MNENNLATKIQSEFGLDAKQAVQKAAIIAHMAQTKTVPRDLSELSQTVKPLVRVLASNAALAEKQSMTIDGAASRVCHFYGPNNTEETLLYWVKDKLDVCGGCFNYAPLQLCLASGLEAICEIDTFHPCRCCFSPLPTSLQVLFQIPVELRSKVIGFETYIPSYKIADVCSPTLQLHRLRTIFYQKNLQ